MNRERMELAGFERLRYFAPTAICVYLALLCLALLVVSALLGKVKVAPAVTASGVYGLLVCGGLGLLFWRAQRRDLRFERIATETDAATNFAAIRSAALEAGWKIRREVAPTLLEADTVGGILAAGERVVVECRGHEVLVASICDPTVGFTLSGRRSCRAHRELVRRVVRNGRPDLEL
jgi:hypothetical protein